MKNNLNRKWSRMGLFHLLVVIGRVTKGIDSWERNLMGGWVWGIMITTIDINVTVNIIRITIATTIMLLLTNAHL